MANTMNIDKSKRIISVLLAIVYLLIPISAKAFNKDDSEWYALFLAGQKSGYSKIERVVSDQTVTTSVTTLLQINRGKTQIQLKTIEQSTETLTGEVISFSSMEEEGTTRRTITGVIEGAVLKVSIDHGGSVKHRQLPWDNSALLFEGQRLLAIEHGLAEGSSYQSPNFLIGALQVVQTKVKIGATVPVELLGKVLKLTKTTTFIEFGTTTLQMVSYVDEFYHFKKMQIPLMGSQLEMIATTEQYALSSNQLSDFFLRLFVSSPVAIKTRQANAVAKYSIVRHSLDAQFVESSEQQVSGSASGIVSIKITPLADVDGKFPYLGQDNKIVQSLAPNSWVQNDDPRLVNMAKNVVRNTVSARRAAQQLERFVRNYIVQKDLNVGYASASQVLKTKRGDCTEHALLLTAMLKAVGIPARVATGVVYMAEFLDQQQVFVPHAWAQAYIGGKWLSFDASLAGFDSTHILFAVGDGDPMAFFSLINTLGNFEIKAITFQ